MKKDMLIKLSWIALSLCLLFNLSGCSNGSDSTVAYHDFLEDGDRIALIQLANEVMVKMNENLDNEKFREAFLHYDTKGIGLALGYSETETDQIEQQYRNIINRLEEKFPVLMKEFQSNGCTSCNMDQETILQKLVEKRDLPVLSDSPMVKRSAEITCVSPAYEDCLYNCRGDFYSCLASCRAKHCR